MDEELKKQLVALVGDMQALATDVRESRKTQAEEKETLEKMQSRLSAIEAAKRVANAALPSDAPIDTKTGEMAAARGGFRALPLRKALTLPANHAMVRGEDAEEIKNLHDFHDAAVIKYHILKKKSDATQAWARLKEDQDFKTYAAILARNGFVQKANEIMHPDSGGVGATLDFTMLSATMIDKMRLELVVADKFREIQLTRPTQKFPTRTADGFGVLGGSTTTSPPARDTISNPFPSAAHFTTPTFSERQFDVKHLLVFMWWNDDMVEDSIVPWLPMMREDISYFAARTLDRAILDGDTTGTHMDDDVTAATDFRKAFYGLRKMSANNLENQGAAALDDGDLHTLRASLGIYGKNPSDLICFMALKQYYELVSLGVLSATIANINAPANVLAQNGVVNAWWGIPIAVSEFVRTDVNATGFNDSSANTKAVVYMANKNRFVRARYGTVQIEDTRVAPMLTTVLQNDVRIDFGAWDERTITSGSFASADDVPVNCLRNVGA